MKTELLEGAKKFWESESLAHAVDGVMMERASELARDLEELFGEDLNGKRILDLGCGTGRIFELYTPLRYVGVDQSANMIAIAEERCAVKVGEPTKEIELYHCDLMDFRANEHFDVVLLLNVLQHVHNPLDLLEHILCFDADTYMIEFFLNTAGLTQYHDTSVGTTSVSRPRAFVDEVVEIMESDGLVTATLIGNALNTNVAPVFVAGWRDE